MAKSELPIRLPNKDEEGTAFIDWLDARVEGNRRARQRFEAFIQEWDHLRDELGAEPTVSNYSERWGMPESSVFRFLDEFRERLAIQNPGDLCELLWNGMPKFGPGEEELVALLSVRVVAV